MNLKHPWLVGALSVLVLVGLGCFLAFYLPATCLTCSSADNLPRACFRGAVLDHVFQVSPKRGNSSADIALNLQVYASAAKLAKDNGADIVVFPENGLRMDRAQGESLPNGKVDMCHDEYAQWWPIAHQLACMAKENGLFLAANMIDLQECTEGKKCPSDGKYAYNTAVLFDRNGTFLAKYHKMHPFGEMTLNVPPKEELIVVDTEIGRLGMQVCFDLIYDKPGVQLAAQGKIDSMLFPTHWFDELPFLGASQYQMAWALGNRINLLASNIHQIQFGSKGSGIYAGGKGDFEVINVADGKSRLLIASLAVSPSSNANCPLNAKTIEVPQVVPIQSKVGYRYQIMNLKENEVVPIDLKQTEISSCRQGVCCTLRYQVDLTTVKSTETFHLLVTNRTRPGAYPWTEEYCGLVHCPQVSNLSACSQMTSNRPLESKFTYAQLSGTFSLDAHVYASAIGSEHKVLPMKTGLWSYNSSKTADKQTFSVTFGQRDSAQSHAISTLALYGRVYSRDPPYQRAPAGSNLTGNWSNFTSTSSFN